MLSIGSSSTGSGTRGGGGATRSAVASGIAMNGLSRLALAAVSPEPICNSRCSTLGIGSEIPSVGGGGGK